MAEPNPELADYFAVSKLYDDWNPPIAIRLERPLSQEERVGYLVVDYWIRLHMGAYDGLLDDDPSATVAALRSVKLDVQAQALENALSRRNRSDQEEALSEIADSLPGSFDVLANNAVAAFLRESKQTKPTNV